MFFLTIAKHVISKLDPSSSRGRPRLINYDIALLKIIEMAKTSQPWKNVQIDGVSYKSLHRTFLRWVRKGVFREIQHRMMYLYKVKRAKPRYYATDTSFIKNMYGTQSIGRNPTDRGRSASKLSVVVDDKGVLIALKLFAANVSDQKVLQPTLAQTELHQNIPMYADKGYDSKTNRSILRTHKLCDRITRRGQKKYRNSARKRIIVEHYFGRLKQYRRLRLRYDKLDETFLSFCSIANILMICNYLQKK